MRIPSRHYDEDIHADRAMTPMIDVVFLLLIFFVCASVGQVRESLLPTRLSQGSIDSVQSDQQDEPTENIWLHVRHAAAGTAVVELDDAGKPLAIGNELEQELRARAGGDLDTPVVLDIDPDVTAGDWVRVYDACLSVGFRSINLAADVSAGS